MQQLQLEYVLYSIIFVKCLEIIAKKAVNKLILMKTNFCQHKMIMIAPDKVHQPFMML